MMIDPIGKEPVASATDRNLHDEQRPGAIAIARIPEVHTQDWFNTVGWITGAGTLALQDGTFNHPGIVRLTTAATLNSQSRTTNSGTGTQRPLWMPNIVSARFVLRAADVTNLRIFAGFFGTDLAADRFGNNSVLFEYNSALSANWRGICNNAGAVTTVTHTSGPVNNVWYVLDMIRTGASAIQFYVNSTLIGTVTTNVPSAACGCGVSIWANAAAARTLDLDLVRFETYQSSRT